MTRASTNPIRRADDGTFWFVIDRGAGYDRKGKWRDRRQARRKGFATQREAKAEMRTIIAEAENGNDRDPSREALGAYLDRWISDTMPNDVSPTTAKSYEAMMRTHVIPRLGEVQLRKLSAQLLNTMYRQLKEPGANKRTPDRGLSPRSIRYIHTILRRALADAVDLDLIAQNPADKAKPPAASRRSSADRMKFWSGDNIGRFLHCAESEADRLLPLWRLIASTGMRRSEAIGLQWGDADLDAGRVTIVRAITTAYGEVFIDAPKTASGARTIQLDSRTVEVLRSHRIRIAEERMQLGLGSIDATDWVFANLDGSHLEPTGVSARFVRQCRRYGLPHIGVHGLRHTWATIALENGVHPRVVMDRLGHADIGTTLGTYSHVVARMDAEAAQSVADSFDSRDFGVTSVASIG